MFDYPSHISSLIKNQLSCLWPCLAQIILLALFTNGSIQNTEPQRLLTLRDDLSFFTSLQGPLTTRVESVPVTLRLYKWKFKSIKNWTLSASTRSTPVTFIPFPPQSPSNITTHSFPIKDHNHFNFSYFFTYIQSALISPQTSIPLIISLFSQLISLFLFSFVSLCYIDPIARLIGAS